VTTPPAGCTVGRAAPGSGAARGPLASIRGHAAPLAVIAVPALVAAILAGCAVTRPSPPPSESPPSGSSAPRPGPTPEGRPTTDPGATLLARSTPAAGRPSGAPPATRLAILGTTENGSLAIYDGLSLVAAPGLSPGRTTWISADAAGRLAATSADGRLFIRDPDPTAAEPGAWEEIIPGDRIPGPDVPLSFGTLSPDGRRVAALAADFAAGTSFDLVTADVRTGQAMATHVAAWPDGAAPAWLPDGRLLIIARDPGHDAPGVILVDPAAPGPAPRLERSVYAIAVSADGRVAAVALPDGRVVAGGTRRLFGALIAGGEQARWASPGTTATGRPFSPGDAPPGGAPVGDARLAMVEAPSGRMPGSLAVDATGTRLAVTWLDVGEGPATVGRYRLDSGQAVAEGSLTAQGGAVTAVAAWLP
jgi:hypothetical protein